MRRLVYAAAALLVASSLTVASATEETGQHGDSCVVASWRLVGTDTFPLPVGYLRSQGAASDGRGWLFSWQGGLSRTNDSYTTYLANTLPPDVAVNHPSADPVAGTNHVGGNHMGDMDVHNGLIYAGVEDGGFNVVATRLNSPEFQNAYVALFDAKTLAYTGRSYLLPHELQTDGVPWVAVDPASGDVYTDEWNMPHDRINVYDHSLHFQRFIPLRYPASFGPGFHLSRIQGAKVEGHTMYAARDDDAKTVYAIDLRTGDVTRLFSLNPTGVAEVEGLALRHTADGALLHVLLVLDGRIDATLGVRNARVLFEHFAPATTCEG
jgi:hypothetical protein